MRFFVDREKKKRVIREKPKLLKFKKKALKNGGIIKYFYHQYLLAQLILGRDIG
jgi:hypothetical protein